MQTDSKEATSSSQMCYIDTPLNTIKNKDFYITELTDGVLWKRSTVGFVATILAKSQQQQLSTCTR